MRLILFAARSFAVGALSVALLYGHKLGFEHWLLCSLGFLIGVNAVGAWKNWYILKNQLAEQSRAN